MSKAFYVTVHNGRVQLDEPVEFQEGTRLCLVLNEANEEDADEDPEGGEELEKMLALSAKSGEQGKVSWEEVQRRILAAK